MECNRHSNYTLYIKQKKSLMLTEREYKSCDKTRENKNLLVASQSITMGQEESVSMQLLNKSN